MNLELLKRLLAVPTSSMHEEQMVSFLVEHINRLGVAQCGQVAVDAHNNVYVVKGGARFLPCVAAHIDTVFGWTETEIVQRDKTLVGMDRHGHQIGIGADDKAGVFVCLELLERFENIAVAFFANEETGCVGAYHAKPEFFEQVGYVLEFDAPARGLVSYTVDGVRLFQNDGDFIQTAMPALQKHGLTHWQRHPYTDVKALRQRFDLSCLNLSAGYHNWHRPDEFVDLEDVDAAIIAGTELIQVLGCRCYPFPVGASDTVDPLIEVTGLSVLKN
jgi:putative aminopeptidase FrvX